MKENEKNTNQKLQEKSKIKVLFVASECQPFFATGGLADVCFSLPRYIKKAFKNVDIRVVMPLYGNISEEYKSNFKYLGRNFLMS